MISIIIPTLNEESVLEKTLDEIVHNFKSTVYEIIVSDGGSKDKTQEIARRYTDKVLVYRDTKRQTIAQARNMGAKAASGEFFVFLDADVTIPHPDDFFHKAIERFQTNKNLLGMTVALAVSKENATLADTVLFFIINRTYALMNNVLHAGASPGEFQMIRRSAFEKLRGYREDLSAAEDNELFYRLSKIGGTRMELGLTAYQTGRRIHKVGWPKLLTLWLTNWFSMMVFKRSVSKEWEPIR